MTYDLRLTTPLPIWPRPSPRLLTRLSKPRLDHDSLLAMVRANLKGEPAQPRGALLDLAFPALFIVIFGVVFGRGMTVEFDVGVAGPESAFRDAVVAALRAIRPAVSTGTRADVPGARGWEPWRGGGLRAEADASAEELAGGDPLLQRDGGTGLAGCGRGGPPDVDRRGGRSALPIEERPVTAQDVSFMDVFVPGILAMSLMNSGVIGLATAFVTYRERGILRRIR